jgi:transmembrane sensor
MKGHQVLSGRDRARQLGSHGAFLSQLLSFVAAGEQLASHCAGPAKPSLIDPQVKQRAIEWLIVLDSPENIHKHWSRFQSWLNERPEHREMYLWVERTWLEAGVIVKQQSGTNSKEVIGVRDRWARIPWRKRRLRLVLGASQLVIACVPLVIAFLLFAPKIQQDTEYASGFDKPTTVVLADDSIVNLNINSRLRARLGWTTRELVLERGEGIFRVKKERSRAFLVHANGTEIRATGTEFSVDLQRDGKTVAAVSQGKVELSPGSLTREQTALSNETPEIKVGEGDQITVDVMGRVQREHPGVLAIQRQSLWKDGLISLDRRPLADWVAVFNQYNRRKLAIVDDSIARIPISGVFRSAEPDSFVQALQGAYGIRPTLRTSQSEPGVTVIELRAANETQAKK